MSNVRKIHLGSGATVQFGSFFRNLTTLTLGTNTFVGKFNHVYSDNNFLGGGIRGSLILNPDSYITNRHELDCSGGIELGNFSAIAGSKSTLQTHSIDFDSNTQKSALIRIGEYSFIGSSCLILMGVEFPAQSVLGAGSLLTSSSNLSESGVYIGRPAKWARKANGDWFTRSSTHTVDYD